MVQQGGFSRRGVSCKDGPCNAEMVRADGNVPCPICLLPYWKHPCCANSKLPESMSSSTIPEYFLHVLCTGLHVKL